VKGKKELFDLAEDPSETTNLASEQPTIVRTLNGAYDVWIAQMANPITGGSKLGKAEASKEELTDREKTRLKTRKVRDVPTGRGGSDAELVRGDPGPHCEVGNPAAGGRGAFRLSGSSGQKCSKPR
jgi:hypothetical protein